MVQGRVIPGDCLAVLPSMAESLYDAIVTDPPYGLEFMGQLWDRPWAVNPANGVGYPGRDDLRLPSHRDNRNPSCALCGGRARGAKRCACPEPQWKPTGSFRRRGNAADVGRTDQFGRLSQHGPEYTPNGVSDMRAYQKWCELWAIEAFRALKPGAHLVAFGGTRTFHRLTCALEDAGFEVRDVLSWLYGSGFPKSADTERAVSLSTCPLPGRHFARALPPLDEQVLNDHVCPMTSKAEPWQGFGTAMKPAWEPIILARKPLVGTVAHNVLEHGTGALNIDDCRIAGTVPSVPQPVGGTGNIYGYANGEGRNGEMSQPNAAGRWPANVVLSHTLFCEAAGSRTVRGDNRGDTDGSRPGGFFGIGSESGDGKPAGPLYGDTVETVWECAEDCPVRMLDKQTGTLSSGSGTVIRESAKGYSPTVFGAESRPVGQEQVFYGDQGGASRFFYTSKASSSERNERLKPAGLKAIHPTVKPLDLMRWLVRLVCRPGGHVLDPFAGSGTTLVACLMEGMDATGIEITEDYVPLAEARIHGVQLGGMF